MHKLPAVADPPSLSETSSIDTATANEMAAVDLGSNSFHMVVARLHHGQLIIVDRLREMVRLASGLGSDGHLDDGSQQRGLDCLSRFGQRLSGLPREHVRVVGTNTLRRIRGGEFLRAAKAALGHPVEVISGMEEARLIYLGASHSLANTSGKTLVIDIGGGSTELIAGQGFEPQRKESLFMGCVGMSQRFFADGKLTTKRFDKARLAARVELRPVKSSFRKMDWAQTVGSSGTIRSAAKISMALGLTESGVSAEALAIILEHMVDARRVDALNLPGLSPERTPVIAGGVAILMGIMDTLQLEHLEVADGSLREGLLHDMVGRLGEEDPRDRTVRGLRARYHVDDAQAERVATTAVSLFCDAQKGLDLDAELGRALSWAAQLHEVGLDISHVKYHQHGAYLLINADLPGFSQSEQQLLAALVGRHRRKLDELAAHEVPDRLRDDVWALVLLLRVAVLLHRSRTETPLPNVKLVMKGDASMRLVFPPGWLAENPLTTADLELEQAYLADVATTLTFKEGKRSAH
jgi:exopolyphosphatase/guanosine-5'-triphosphate,3'-diphosphate pyrophosphatase